MTVQPATGDPFFEMEDAYRWFAKRYAKVDPADLMNLSALDPPPGYADLQEQRLKLDKRAKWYDSTEWHHFRIYREKGAPTLAVVLTVRSQVDVVADHGSLASFMAALELLEVNRVWLYEHRQGRGWVCLDPKDESHEVVRNLRAQMVLEALK